ncbi:MAG TPA: hypothetical protein VIF09_23845, partial [Polyangiaceae bacterium]
SVPAAAAGSGSASASASASGSAPAPAPLSTLARAPGNCGAVALDDTYAYWIGSDGVNRVPRRGGGPVVTLVPAPANRDSDDCGFLAVDGSDVVWTFAESGGGARPTLWRAPKSGLPGATPVAVVQAPIACLAATDDAVVFLQLRPDGVWAAGGTVRRAPTSGGPSALIATVPTPSFGCVAADAERVYVATFDEHSATGDGAIRSFARNGGGARTVTRVVAFPLWLKVGGDALYWIEADSLMSAPRAGGRPTKIVTAAGPCGGIEDYAVDDAGVYFTCGDSIWRVDRHGGAAAVRVVEGQRGAQGLAVDADALYWLNGDPSFRGRNDGALMRLAKR